MLAGNRGGGGKVGLALALILAGIIAFVLWRDASSSETAAQIDAQNRAADYANTERIDVNPKCVILKLSEQDCAIEAQKAARPDQRNEYDLEAQRTMAAWTRAMGIAAVIGMGVGIFGLGLIFMTLRETRRAADAGYAAVESSQKGVRQLDKSAKAELRAYLVVQKASYHFDYSDAPPIVKLNLLNVGQTPAYEVCATGVIRFIAEGDHPENIRFDMRQEPRTILGRDVPMPMEIETDEGGQSCPDKGQIMVAIGEIRYTDIFRQKWVQRFAWRQMSSFGGGRLGPAIFGNGEKRQRK